ncbi:MAG TPA: sugar phosphate isomerase/epimerase family protein [Vicinamibacterales bacterium]|nr:sugar phosphate isomerase/epimerase family protein [Vicinamibacterales bacterium]
MPATRFGLSTHLFHSRRLTREDLVHVAAHEFEMIELFATRSHFDYRDMSAAIELREWLSDTRLELHSVHAPIMEAMRDGHWVGSCSIAAADETKRRAAVAEVQAALAIASSIPYRYLVLHIGVPADKAGPGDNQPDAARRSVIEIVEAAARVNVGVALEVMPNPLSGAEGLVHTIEDQLDGLDVGVCLDYGHAHLMTDLTEAIETLSGHLWTTHVHDNHGKRDEHLVPYAGTINWDEAMMATQKIGYEGALMFEVTSGAADPIDVLKRITRARERLAETFVGFSW